MHYASSHSREVRSEARRSRVRYLDRAIYARVWRGHNSAQRGASRVLAPSHGPLTSPEFGGSWRVWPESPPSHDPPRA